MKIVQEKSFRNGMEILKDEYHEICSVIKVVEPKKIKISKEKSKLNQILISPTQLNKDFKKAFNEKGWFSYKVGSSPSNEINFLKNGIGVETEFKKYPFSMFDVGKGRLLCGRGIYEKVADVMVLILPTKKMKGQMSNGIADADTEINRLCSHGGNFPDYPLVVLGVE